MKYALISFITSLTFLLVGCEQTAQNNTDLPWKITVSDNGNPQVFQLELGKSTLKESIERLHSFPEMAVFAHESGKQYLEAYFGKHKIGMLEGKFITELSTDEATFTKFKDEFTKREGMASGMWKYTISEANVKNANNFPIEKLIYMPVADYEPDVVSKRFGIPTEKLSSQQKGVEYWVYPDKGCLILMNSQGGDIVYYTTKQRLPQLKKELLEAKPNDE